MSRRPENRQLRQAGPPVDHGRAHRPFRVNSGFTDGFQRALVSVGAGGRVEGSEVIDLLRAKRRAMGAGVSRLAALAARALGRLESD